TGRITDRRAGRIATELNLRLTERLRRIKLPGVEVFVESGKDYRFVLVLRGFDQLPKLPRFPEVFGLRSAAIAAYPMYRGLARLVGMEILKTGNTFDDELATLREHWAASDFFFLHYKDTDKAGEDGNFDAKVQALERLDRAIPEI